MKSALVERRSLMRIAILDDYFNTSRELADWSQLDNRATIKVFNKHLDSEENASKMLADFEIIIGMRERMPFPASLIRRLPKLKLLITTGMHNRSFDLEEAQAQGIIVCGTRSGNNETAELAIGLMIALMRDIHGQFDSMRQRGWQTRPGHELAGKTLGLLGLGRLGGTVAAVGNAFNMRVIAWSQNLTERRAAECNACRVEKDDLFRRSDVLSIHLVLSDRTRCIVGARELGLMAPTAYFINTSRGQGKKIAGAALDVYGMEPLPADHPIRTLDNVLLTPHIGYVTVERLAKMYQDAVEDIVAFLDKKPIRVLK
jgi:phosphoglycerate dehydrogenase-like enzyme